MKKDGHVLKMAVDFEVECQWKKGTPNRKKKHFVDQSGMLALI